MSASTRLPWRAVGRSIMASPSTHLLRTQCPANFSMQAHSRQYASDSTVQSKEPTPNHSDLAAPATSSPSAADLKKIPVDEPSRNDEIYPRIPRAVQAAYLKPLRRDAEYGVPSCNLQLRSHSVRNLEFFADFALRAAYYLGLPAYGPVALPRIVERWTVPRSSFIHKKSQENFERKTLRRLIQIKDGHPETVQIWLAFLQKHAYYGIAMKANVWEFSKLDVGAEMDLEMSRMKQQLDSTLDRFAFKKGSSVENKALEILGKDASRRVYPPTEVISGPLSDHPQDWYDEEDEEDEDKVE